jgi:hypothetical protein
MIFTEKLPRQTVKIIKHLLIVTIAVKKSTGFWENAYNYDPLPERSRQRKKLDNINT